MRITEYFKNSELVCSCGCGFQSKLEAVERLYAMRLILGNPLIINSAARCAKYNKKINGAKHSRHVSGQAFDISTRGLNSAEIIYNAMSCGFKGIGISDNFIHVDIRDEIVSWTY